MHYQFGDVVLVPFPFTNQLGIKQRPAVVVSTAQYQTKRADIVLMPVSSQVRQPLSFGELLVQDWQAANLLKLSLIKPSFGTFEQSLIIKSLGTLSLSDKAGLRALISTLLVI
jgi:mRNA interferase MazF